MSVRILSRAVWLAVAVAALVVAGCGSKKDNNTTTAAATLSTPAAKVSGVPAAITAKGTLSVAADATYAPNEFIGSDGKTVMGMDADLADAIGKQLGIKVDVLNATFDGIIPGLASGKYDLGMSSFTDTKEREKTVDFVTYFSAGTSFFEQATGGPTVNTLADLCGLTVAAEKGTTQADDATAQGKKCKKAGKKGVNVLVFPDQNGSNLALSSGRAQVGMADSPVAAYAVKQSGGKFKLTGKSYGEAPYGIAIPKGNGLAKPIQQAVKNLIADGEYKTILTKWGVQDGAITDPVINGATS